MKNVRYILFFTITLIFYCNNSAATELSKHNQDLHNNFNLMKPAGDGPFPSVIFVSGCSGYKWTEIAYKHYHNVANKFVAKGFAVIFVDFLAPRNANNCFGIDANSVADDVFYAASYLAKQNFINKNDINILGWSFGGKTVLEIVNRDYAQQVFNKAITYYPLCSTTAKWQSHIPLLILSGGIDDVTPFIDCRKMVDSSANSSKVKFRVFENARHAFDFEGYPEKKQYVIGTIGYNAKAAKKAWRNVEKFIFRD